MKPLYRPPAIYAADLERRRRDTLDAAERQARAGRKKIAGALEAHGERMSEDGKEMLKWLAEVLEKAAVAMAEQR